MNFKKTISILMAMGLIMSFVGCGKNSDNKSTVDTAEKSTVSTQKTTSAVTTQAGETTEPTTQTPSTAEVTTEPVTEKSTETITLSNTYTTSFDDVNAITYPEFSIDYPDNWSVRESSVNADGEKFTLSNGEGARVVFFMSSALGKNANLGAGSRSFSCVEAKKIADSSFVPSMVQGTDYSSLGKFAVLEQTVTQNMHTSVDKGYKPTGYNVSYAVSPESNAGEKRDVQGVIQGAYSFWYASVIMVYADDTDNNFTEQEQKEAIEILKSFRLA